MNCYICYSVYRDPRVLACGHSYCCRCIRRLFENSNFFCPICRQPILVENGWIPTKNYQLAGIVRELKEWERIQRVSVGVPESSASEHSSDSSQLEIPLIDTERLKLNTTQKIYLSSISLATFPFVANI